MGLFQPIDESIHDVINVNSAFKHQAIPGKYNTKPEGVGIYKAMNTDLKSNKPGITGITRNNIKKAKNQISNGSHNFLKPEKNYLSGYASASKHYANESSEYFDESIHDVVNMNSSGRGINGELRPFYSGMNSKIKNSNSEEEKQFNRNHAKKMVKNAMQGNFSKMGLRRSDLTRFADGRKFPQDGQKFANEATEGISLSTKKLISAGGHNSSDLNAVKPNAEYFDQYDKHFIGDGEDPETSRYNVPAILAAKTAGGAPFDQTLSNGINRASADVFHLKKLRDDEGMNG